MTRASLGSLALFASLLGIGAAASCSAANNGTGSTFGAGGDGNSTDGQGGSASTHSTAHGSPPSSSAALNPVTSGTSGTGVGGAACGGSVKTADPVPLDLFIMLDRSGSMNDKTSTGATKWASVTTALKNFFNQSQGQQLSIGLQFFPLLNAGAPGSCTSTAQCGAFGKCELKVCNDGTGKANPPTCDSTADCAAGTCVAAGACHIGGKGCYPAGTGVPCANGSSCDALASSICTGGDSCTASDYAAPSVPIAGLDAAQITMLGAAFAGTSPSGQTPTSAGLSGAIQYASTYAGAHTTDTTAVIFVTDGLPTECSPQDIPGISAIASAGASATPSVKTFVVGVFNQDDLAAGAQANLDSIAQAGSGNDAFIVDTSGNVAQQFQMALDAIKGKRLACTYEIPAPAPGDDQDFNKVNVEYTPSGASTPTTILYVGDMASCDPTTGGWYYDVDPAHGTPTQIIMCPQTCTLFEGGGAVNIRVGCETVGPH